MSRSSIYPLLMSSPVDVPMSSRSRSRSRSEKPLVVDSPKSLSDTNTATSANINANANTEAEAAAPPPPYILRDHCRYLGLKTETTETHTYWYCDWTSKFVQRQPSGGQHPHQHHRHHHHQHPHHQHPHHHHHHHQHQHPHPLPPPPPLLLKDVVKEYCQPFATVAELQELWVGISCLSEQSEDPLPVRTVSIRLRPDCLHYTILQAVHQAFTALHGTQYHIVKSTPDTFQAIGANGAVPFFVSAYIGVHKTTLERRLWIRLYHVESVRFAISREEEEESSANTPTPTATATSSSTLPSSTATVPSSTLQMVLAGGHSHQTKAPLRNVLTPINTQLAEACVLIQFVVDGELTPSFPCPEVNQEETTRFFQTTYHASTSVLEETKNLARHRCHLKRLFPSLAHDDYPILQESHPLIDRIWSELELRCGTYNTLGDESLTRFGMRPCQSTLDKTFCHQLSQISQQHMLMELHQQIQKAETILHDTLGEYQELETLLVYVLRRKYNIPHNENETNHSNNNNNNTNNSSAVGVDIGQTPIRMTKRKMAEFPWHDDVKRALDDISHRIAEGCLHDFDAAESIQMADDAVQHAFTAFGKVDDLDQQLFLKQRNRQAMIRVAQQQAVLKGLLVKVILAPTQWPGLPKLMANVNTWYEISLQASTSNLRRTPVPLVEFRTRLGQGCITAHQIMLMSGLLTTTVLVMDWVDIDVKHTPTHPLTKVTITENGKRIAGFNPTNVDALKLVKTIHVLKGLQEA